MKMNEDCIRDVLHYLVENLTLELTNERGGFGAVSLISIMNEFTNQYSKDDIWYSVYNLSHSGFIESDDIKIKSKTSGFAFVEIYNVTYRGHQFYSSIQPEPIWSKTKGVIAKVGVHTLGFIENVAHDIAVESAKQVVASIMLQ